MSDDTTPSPSANGSNGAKGRAAGGKFAKGNRGGPGNPHARRVGEIRAKLLQAVTDDDLAAVVRTLIDKAKAGEQWAVKELLQRLIGDARWSESDPVEATLLGFPYGIDPGNAAGKGWG